MATICGHCFREAGTGHDYEQHPAFIDRQEKREAEEDRLRMTIEDFVIPEKPCGDCFRFIGHMPWCLTHYFICENEGDLPVHRHGQHPKCTVRGRERTAPGVTTKYLPEGHGYIDPWLGVLPGRGKTIGEATAYARLP